MIIIHANGFLCNFLKNHTCPICGKKLKKYSDYRRFVVFDNNCKEGAPPQQWDPGEKWKPMEQEKPGQYDELVVFGEVRDGKQELLLKRVYCEGSEHHTHVILPEFVIPYVRYLSTFYEHVINSEQSSEFRDVSTVNEVFPLSRTLLII